MARTDVSTARRQWMVRLAGAGLCCLWALSSQGCQDNIPTDIEVDGLDPQPDANAEQNPDPMPSQEPDPQPQPDPNPQVNPIECESNTNCEDDELCVLEAGLCGGTGVCEDRPQGCPEIFSPVCGCDGQTYGNDCEAAADGVSVLHVGECEPPGGCTNNDDCGDAQYCALEVGLCGGEGVCETRPEACTDEADPVCGCDDTTYGNACQAAQEGVSIAREGRCDGPPDTCETSEDCGRGSFCECSGDACGEGVCAVAPQECPDVFDPVCGCDGRIYPNDCDRRNAGVCLAPEERCEEPIERCLNNDDCSDNAFCEFEPGTCGEEGSGVCAERPEGCFDVVEPVCGCDGETYTNDCQRQLAGVSQVHEGECEAPPNSCGSNRECGEGEFCECRGNACGLGLCEDRPRNCTEEFAPVCGCDNVTYGNDCARQAEGVCFLHRGECEQGPIRCEGNGDCGDREYCQFEADTCGGVGLCEIRPDVCPDVEAPVCGCDGQTYGNRCVAAASGVSVEREGACDDTPQACRSNEGCDRGEFCECRGDACGAGVCADRPNACPDIFAPVCGCDNTTYSNDCERQAAGACLLHRGECEAPPEGCRNQNDCGDVEVCIFNDGDCFNRERIGACEERPEFCNRLLDPVCGCDGETYGNRCEATRAGVSVAFEGECEDPPQLCEDSDDCGEGNFCECRGEACGDGVCEPRPELCTRELAPVCGCDNETYTNDCLRRAAGTCLLHRGACDEPVDDCRNNEDCGEGNFCEHEPGTCFNRERIGACEERPELCTRELAPVCGCDGETYTNDCQRRAAGVALDHRGECGDPAEDCRENEDCARGEFCAKDAGACRDEEPTIGACEPRPERCPLVLDPVCGCDGTTYGNACEAAQEGINILHDGACDDPNDVCISDRECENNAYCAFEDGVCGGEGICEDRPRACPDIFAPVCGCDFQTYGNACEAASEGVSIGAEGECPEPGTCENNAQCGRDGYCVFDEGVCGGIGSCERRPDLCPDVVDPVCGCDGQTYGNACEAAGEGVSVRSEGECPEPGGDCRDNGDCRDRQYCSMAPGVCLEEDAVGVCSERPGICPLVVDPVCGCDGRTYNNSCDANSRGVNIVRRGACDEEPRVCGGIQGLECRRGEFCDPDVDTCNVPDSTGVCTAVEELCEPISAPVCGCDGRSYRNDCLRIQAGVGKQAEGECRNR